MAYLVFFGSMIGFTAYIYILKHSTATRVATYAFVNPVVALFLGWLLLGESITLRTILAAAVILAAVLLVITAPHRQAATHCQRCPRSRRSLISFRRWLSRFRFFFDAPLRIDLLFCLELLWPCHDEVKPIRSPDQTFRRVPRRATGALRLSRDARADGTFVLAVRSTQIYCRPSCPARRPLRRNVVFFRTPRRGRKTRIPAVPTLQAK